LIRHLAFISLLALLPLSVIQAAELQLNLGSQRQTLSSAQLLAHPKVQQIEIPNDVSYKRHMRYHAVPLAALLTGVAPGDHLQLVASDGFAAELSAMPVLSQTGSQAWLAIEDPAQPWARANPARGRFIWFGKTRPPARSARNNGPSSSPPSAPWRPWRNASRNCCPPPMRARPCRRVLPTTRKTAWLVTA